jgi:hypothetical protein
MKSTQNHPVMAYSTCHLHQRQREGRTVTMIIDHGASIPRVVRDDENKVCAMSDFPTEPPFMTADHGRVVDVRVGPVRGRLTAQDNTGAAPWLPLTVPPSGFNYHTSLFMPVIRRSPYVAMRSSMAAGFASEASELIALIGVCTTSLRVTRRSTAERVCITLGPR